MAHHELIDEAFGENVELANKVHKALGTPATRPSAFDADACR